MFKRLSLILVSTFLLPFAALPVSAALEGEVETVCADGVNVTRWADLLIVYKDIPHTAQNEWGHNVVVGSDGRVTKIVEGADPEGRNLPIPEGGMVVSATGVKVKLLENIKPGDYVRFHEPTMRVLISKSGDISDISFSESLKITAFNQPRLAFSLIVYDKAGTKTETNDYGYEISVNGDGMITESGGNNSLVQEGGFVVSAIEPEDKLFLKSFGVVGARCEIAADKRSVTISYDGESITRSTEIKLGELEADFTKAKAEYRLIDYVAAEAAINAVSDFVENGDYLSFKGNTELYMLIEKAAMSLKESKAVETRGVWYEPLEKDLAGVQKTVKRLADNGINQLCLGLSGGKKAAMPLPEEFAFEQSAALRGFDLWERMLTNAKAGIELVSSVTVFHSTGEPEYAKWLTKPNKEGAAEANSFYSPANDEYFAAFSEYIEYILENYEINGLQLDYIRYPYFDGAYDYGYDDITKQGFAESEGVDVSVVDEIGEKLTSHELWEKWVAYKAGLVTKRVKELGELIKEKRRDVYYSVCLAADTYSLSLYCQDGGRWVKEGLIDAVYPMSYAEGIMASQTQYFTSFDGDYYCFEGSGSYLSFSKKEQQLQVEQSREYGADGICFFELGAYFDHGYADYLENSVFSEKAVSPTYNSGLAAKLCVERARKRLTLDSEMKNADLSSEEKILEAIKGRENEAWYPAVKAELDFAEKIKRLSKDEYKELPEEETSVVEQSASDNSGEESTGETKKSSALLFAGIAAAVVAVSGIVIVLLKKKKK